MHLSLSFISAIVLTVLVNVFWVETGWFYPLLEMSENQGLYIYSAAAQVIAGVYGLTIAGYVFLRNQQDRQVDKDETLSEIFDRIQVKQYNLVLFITILSTTAILASLLAIALEEVVSQRLVAAAYNFAASSFVSSILWTGFFVTDAMRPGKVSAASESIKDEIAGSVSDEPKPSPEAEPAFPSKANNLEEFLRNFNGIEKILDRFAEDHLDRGYDEMTGRPSTTSDVSNEKQVPRVRWTKRNILKAMASEKLVSNVFVEEVSSLVRFRNALVHGHEMDVSSDMVRRVKAARSKLKKQFVIDRKEKAAQSKVKIPDHQATGHRSGENNKTDS